MKKCKHENAEHLFAGGIVEPGWNMSGHVAQCEQFRCLDCAAWLSLGHSDEGPVRVEVRAAEIAADLSDVDGGCEMSTLEITGFHDEPFRTRGGGEVMLSTSSVLAGYLARCIVDHDGGGVRGVCAREEGVAMSEPAKCISRYSQCLGQRIMCSLPARHAGLHVGGYTTPLGSEIVSWVGGMCGSQRDGETCALIYGHDGDHANTLACGIVPGKVTWR